MGDEVDDNVVGIVDESYLNVNKSLYWSEDDESLLFVGMGGCREGGNMVVGNLRLGCERVEGWVERNWWMICCWLIVLNFYGYWYFDGFVIK